MAKRGGTKRKIPIAKIQKKESLRTAYTKRCHGLFSKASQYCLLFGAQIAVLATPSSESHASFYSYGHSSVDAVVTTFLTGQSLVSSETQQMSEDHDISMTPKDPEFGYWWTDERLHNSENPEEMSEAIESMKNMLKRLKAGGSVKSDVVSRHCSKDIGCFDDDLSQNYNDFVVNNIELQDQVMQISEHFCNSYSNGDALMSVLVNNTDECCNHQEITDWSFKSTQELQNYLMNSEVDEVGNTVLSEDQVHSSEIFSEISTILDSGAVNSGQISHVSKDIGVFDADLCDKSNEFVINNTELHDQFLEISENLCFGDNDRNSSTILPERNLAECCNHQAITSIVFESTQELENFLMNSEAAEVGSNVLGEDHARSSEFFNELSIILEPGVVNASQRSKHSAKDMTVFDDEMSENSNKVVINNTELQDQFLQISENVCTRDSNSNALLPAQNLDECCNHDEDMTCDVLETFESLITDGVFKSIQELQEIFGSNLINSEVGNTAKNLDECSNPQQIASNQLKDYGSMMMNDEAGNNVLAEDDARFSQIFNELSTIVRL